MLSRMEALLKSGGRPYLDLTLSFEDSKQEDIPGPPVRYYFN